MIDLHKLGDSIIYRRVFKPHEGHVIDYKVTDNNLVIVVEKPNRELFESVYKPTKEQQREFELPVEKVEKPQVAKLVSIIEPKPTKPVSVCHECGSEKFIYRWNQQQNTCVNKIHGTKIVLFDNLNER